MSSFQYANAPSSNSTNNVAGAFITVLFLISSNSETKLISLLCTNFPALETVLYLLVGISTGDYWEP